MPSLQTLLPKKAAFASVSREEILPMPRPPAPNPAPNPPAPSPPKPSPPAPRPPAVEQSQ